MSIPWMIRTNTLETSQAHRHPPTPHLTQFQTNSRENRELVHKICKTKKLNSVATTHLENKLPSHTAASILTVFPNAEEYRTNGLQLLFIFATHLSYGYLFIFQPMCDFAR